MKEVKLKKMLNKKRRKFYLIIVFSLICLGIYSEMKSNLIKVRLIWENNENVFYIKFYEGNSFFLVGENE